MCRVLVVVLLVVAAPAHAFKIESTVTPSCHEDLTLTASARVGFPSSTGVPAPTEDQRRALDDLTFTLPRRDIWLMALLIGVRSNDIRDFAPSDLASLVAVHSDPDDQDAHCLRSQSDDGPAGDVSALAACRAFMLAELEMADLLADGDLDTAATEPVSVFLAFRGRVTLALPRFAYRLGRALHTLEDSYTHAFRDPSTGAITHVTNWIDVVHAGFDADTDGYGHVNVLDNCQIEDPRVTLRVARAKDATAALLAAIADPAPGRRGRVEAAIDAALAYQPGCDATNRYCDAEELDEEADAGGCAVAGGSVAMLVLVALAVGVSRSRGRRRGRGGRRSRAGRPRRRGDRRSRADRVWRCGRRVARRDRVARNIASRIAVVVLLAAPSVRAEPLRWHIDTRLGGSLDRAGGAMIGGLSVDVGRFTAGAALEWNPWVSLDAGTAQPGAFNAYATLSRTWYRSQALSLYSRAELGTSTVLFELVGVDRYNTGVYLGGSLLGVRIPLRRGVALTFDPSHFAMPTPQLVGLPFYYIQYRVTVGAEFRLP